MAATTKVFDFFYKRIQSSSAAAMNIQELWYDTDATITTNVYMSSSFLNYPNDTVAGGGAPFGSTTASKFVTTRTVQSGYYAIPWGNAAIDWMWNIQVPSWSYTDTTRGGQAVRRWAVTYVSKSFHYFNWPHSPLTAGALGSSSYNVTSSWIAYDPRQDNFDINYQGGWPGFVIDNYATFAYELNYPTSETSSVDYQFFDQSGGAAISRASISSSLQTQSLYETDDTVNNSAASRVAFTRALKARRLYFPTPFTGSGTTNSRDYWFNRFTGVRARDLFDENGGIYNVKLTIKRHGVYTPDTGSFMSVFIHNVSVGSTPRYSDRVPGADGWYPPDNNIIKIGNGYNGSPVMTFLDTATGYLVEKFDFNVIQYGYPAQFCIEPSGSFVDQSFFGIIIDDIQICKVGVTTDPRFIKPATIGSIVTNTNAGSQPVPPSGGGGEA